MVVWYGGVSAPHAAASISVERVSHLHRNLDLLLVIEREPGVEEGIGLSIEHRDQIDEVILVLKSALALEVLKRFFHHEDLTSQVVVPFSSNFHLRLHVFHPNPFIQLLSTSIFYFSRIVFGRGFRKYMIFIVKSSGFLIISILIINACIKDVFSIK